MSKAKIMAMMINSDVYDYDYDDNNNNIYFKYII
jgi:hypothetical protein